MHDMTENSDSGRSKQSLLDEIASLRTQLANAKAATRSGDYDSLFAQFPLGMQEENYSGVKVFIDNLQAEGAVNLRQYFEENPKVLHDLITSTRITNVNQALLDIAKYESVQDFMDDEADFEGWWEARWVAYYAAEFASLAAGVIYQDEISDARYDDSTFQRYTMVTIVNGYEKTWEKVITIFLDVTERNKYEQALIEAKLDAEQANKAKSDFLSSISHELRTPLNAILGFAELIEYDDNIDHLSSVREIGRAGEHLLRLIDEILDLARIESGEVKITIEPVSVIKVIEECLAWVVDMAQDNGVSIHFESVVFDQLFVLADNIKLKQAILNLLTNAIKYSRANGQVGIIYEKADGELVRIGIRDTGPGISEDQIRELFQPFRRLGAELSGVEGTGLGLVITRRLMQRMHGRLEVDSVHGKGSTFWIELPLAQLESEGSTESIKSRINREPSSAVSAVRRQVLVAEDNQVNRELILAQMKHLGYETDVANSGPEALRLWRSGRYKLLITDIRMPEMDGCKLIRQIRSAENGIGRSRPIIVISANVVGDAVNRCFEAGANDVLSKPVKIADLRTSIEKWLK